mmetsp:Transcript_27625/g.80055  ORF Transcript_27625/g.80055 Transcript_27625/m.80055 type:complete len:97 (-) Transcript_27625:86-376(-)
MQPLTSVDNKFWTVWMPPWNDLKRITSICFNFTGPIDTSVAFLELRISHRLVTSKLQLPLNLRKLWLRCKKLLRLEKSAMLESRMKLRMEYAPWRS